MRNRSAWNPQEGGLRFSGGVDLREGGTVQNRIVVSAAVLATLVVAALAALATAQPSGAFIHEMIGANCRFGNEDVEPPGQTPGPPGGNAQSTIRALLATGVISSIEITATQQIVNFDLDRPEREVRLGRLRVDNPGRRRWWTRSRPQSAAATGGFDVPRVRSLQEPQTGVARAMEPLAAAAASGGS